MKQEDAHGLVSLLAAAFPQYPLAHDSIALYVAAFEKVDMSVGLFVVQEWVQTRIVFPKIAELLEESTAEQLRRDNTARAIRAGQTTAGARGMTACKNCRDSKWEEQIETAAPIAGYLAVLPCRVCDPARHRYWADGHLAEGHDASSCDHPWCENKQKNGRIKRATRSASEPRRVDTAALAAGER